MMKKGLIATTLAGTVLATGVLTGQAHAAEQLNVNNAKDIANKATINDQAKKASFSPGLSSDLGYNQSYTTQKKGDDYIISSPDEGAYTYRLTSEGKLYFMTKYDGKEYFISQTDVENGSQQSDQNNTNMNHQSTTTQTVANAHQQQEQSSQATALPETGQQTSNSGVMLSSILGIIGSAVLLISRKFKQQA
ncbi:MULTISPECIES: LPXTG cell wall anchor domain-containing protein [Staphylococcus]|jgi:LPXTG-motif cell wall-anchored protein|nr:LPXTG cell wall anchor domain-containing protein [Staphylococcus warneri]EEQ81032.1 LPXTG-motif cell wall anchor domain protein [Staphylococcus warneri L37603]QSF51935.1 LPXTG cell wall anchor domain-containing protein [Staphylococcus sp. SB1-57]HBY83587.1 LPXTG cell wall anchor domain-containing protein [Staphylococcus sp.]MBO0377228.1 LPXTG cell wall anchor domain-containing protein [Staphylococcus warneri]MCI2776377.1 LPXTG cell wall anchor domain-containing protein [Staphylococcus warne